MDTPTNFEVPTHEIDREIYAMPAFTTLEVEDLEGSLGWYEAVGFVQLFEMGAGPARLLHLRRYRYQDILLVQAASDAPRARSRSRTSFAHTGPLDELDDVVADLERDGHGDVTGPTRTPWNAIEVAATDADGHVVVLTARSDTPPSQELLDQLAAGTTS